MMRECAIAKHCAFIFVVLALGDVRLAKAQDNYEIQVYGSDTVVPKTTMLEPHSNFTAEGSLPVPGSRFTERLMLTCGALSSFDVRRI
ncbi:MAG: hypothetical protein ABSF15_29235 [Candidatus Sulfotelmatobacter sp.]